MFFVSQHIQFYCAAIPAYVNAGKERKKAKKELQRSFALFMNKENSEDVKNKMFDRLVIVHTYTK